MDSKKDSKEENEEDSEEESEEQSSENLEEIVEETPSYPRLNALSVSPSLEAKGPDQETINLQHQLPETPAAGADNTGYVTTRTDYESSARYASSENQSEPPYPQAVKRPEISGPAPFLENTFLGTNNFSQPSTAAFRDSRTPQSGYPETEHRKYESGLEQDFERLKKSRRSW